MYRNDATLATLTTAALVDIHNNLAGIKKPITVKTFNNKAALIARINSLLPEAPIVTTAEEEMLVVKQIAHRVNKTPFAVRCALRAYLAANPTSMLHDSHKQWLVPGSMIAKIFA